jgi:predicted nucleic acid-binding protein
VEGVTCPEILDELVRKLQSKLRLSEAQALETLTDLLSFLRVVLISNTLHVIPTDPDDDKVVECALVAGATHIVTGDRHHLLPLQRYRDIAIIPASQLLMLVASSGNATG